jgi:hypothetical protein
MSMLMLQNLKIPSQCIAAKTETEVEEIERRLIIFRSKQYDIDNLKDKTVCGSCLRILWECV